MDGRSVDTFTRLVAAGASRRGVIGGTLAALVGALLGAPRPRRKMAMGAEGDPLQYDPVAFVGNVALALPDFETTPIAFVFDPQQAVADGYFYGADPPDGWQGLLRTALYVPDPDGASGQGISQALYLKGHWFDTNGSARDWYRTGQPLVEASGNGSYVDQTGEAGFGIQRTVWGASFPTADNPDVTINRGIAWFRRGNVVLEAMLDVYCSGATAATGAAGQRTAKAAAQPFGAFCDDGVVPHFNEELGALLDDHLAATETESVVTRHLPVLTGTPVVEVVLTQWGDRAITEFGATAEERARREAFGFGADGHLSSQYAGVDADGKPVAVFTNTWFVELYHEGQVLLLDDLVEFVAASDERTGFERTEIPSLALSGEGWAVTANGFTIPREDGTKLGGVEVRGVFVDGVVATAAVVESTPLPPETTPQDVRADFEQRIAAAAQDPEEARDASLAVLITVVSVGLGVGPRDVLDALGEGEFALPSGDEDDGGDDDEFRGDGDDDDDDGGVTELLPPEIQIPTGEGGLSPEPVGKYIDYAIFV